MSELGNFWQNMFDKIPNENFPEKKVFRFCSATIILAAENMEDCRKIITKAWDEAFPDEQAITEILVSKYTKDEEVSELMRVIYNNYYGVDEYQRLITELTQTIPIFREKEALDVFRRTNYLFAIDQGCGFSTLLSSFGDYLHRLRVYKDEEYDKRTKYFEMKIGPDDDNGNTEVDTAISSLSESLSENEFNIIGFDISYFLEKNKQDDLRNFLRRLDSFQSEYIFAFRIPFLEKKSFDDVKEMLSDMMIIKDVQIPPYHDCILMEVFWNLLNDNNFVPDISLLDLIPDKIRQEKTDGRFYGFKTITKLAGELMHRKAADIISKEAKGEEADRDVVYASDLSGFVDKSAFEVKGYEALKEMIGMEKITERIREIIAQVKLAISDKELDRPCIHMRFTGAPGTGKTTVARIIGQIMKEEGILRKGAFLEYTGRELCGEYVGQTAVKTSSICRDSYGSVLFIDEAYALYGEEHQANDFGKEAITTLISEMENHRDDMLVVMAGYIDEMETLMKANPGLRSRMPYIIEFPNYSRDQLFQIFMKMVKKHFEYSEDFETEAKKYFDDLSDEMLSSKEFANARFVRNLYERSWSKAALRASLAGSKIISLSREDFVAASAEKEFSEKLNLKKRIGF